MAITRWRWEDFAAPDSTRLRELFAAKLESAKISAHNCRSHRGEGGGRPLGGLGRRGTPVPWTENTITASSPQPSNEPRSPRSCWFDRGELDLARVSPRTGPIRGQGKAGIKVRHLLSHTSGSRAGPAGHHRTTCTTGTSRPPLLAAQAPWWSPGGLGYHALPFVPEAVCVRTGAGGSIVLVDAIAALTVAYVMNKMAPGMIAAR